MDTLDTIHSLPLNFAGLPDRLSNRDGAGVFILPVPYDATVEWHAGTRDAPQSIITASRYLEMYDQELDREICDIGIHTLLPLDPVLSGPEDMVKRVYSAAGRIIDQKKFPVMIGGEHTVSIGMVRALREKYDDLCVLQFDAHADLRDEYLGSRFSHACTMRRIIEYCPVTQVGIRSFSLEERDFMRSCSLKPFFMEDLNRNAAQQIVDSLAANVYITIDVDVFDPSIMSAVATPEPGGMLWRQVLEIAKLAAQKRNVVGFDVVELCPQQGPDACSYTAARLIYKLIGYAFSASALRT
jgi:agmatinase